MSLKNYVIYTENYEGMHKYYHCRYSSMNGCKSKSIDLLARGLDPVILEEDILNFKFRIKKFRDGSIVSTKSICPDDPACAEYIVMYIENHFENFCKVREGNIRDFGEPCSMLEYICSANRAREFVLWLYDNGILCLD